MPPKRKSEAEDVVRQQQTREGGSDVSDKERQKRSTRFLPDSELTAEQLAKRIKGREAQARMKEKKALAKANADGGGLETPAKTRRRKEARGGAADTGEAGALGETAPERSPAVGKNATAGTPTAGKRTPPTPEPAEPDARAAPEKRRASMPHASVEPGSSRTSTRTPSSSESPATLAEPSEARAAAVPTLNKGAQPLKAPKTRLSAAVPDSELTPEQLARRLKNREAYRKQLEEKRKRDAGERQGVVSHSSTEDSSPQKTSKAGAPGATRAKNGSNVDAAQADAAATSSTAKANEAAKQTTLTKAKTTSRKSDKPKEAGGRKKQVNSDETVTPKSSTTPAKQVSKPRKSSAGTAMTKSVPETESLTTVSDQQGPVQDEGGSRQDRDTTANIKKASLPRKRKSEHMSMNETSAIPIAQERMTEAENIASAAVKESQPSKKRKSTANATQEVTPTVQTPVKRSLEQNTGSTPNASHLLAHVPDSELTPQQLARRLKNRKSNMNKRRKKRELELAKQGSTLIATPVSLNSTNTSTTNVPITPTATGTPSKTVPGQKPLESGASDAELQQKPSKSERKKRAREAREQEDPIPAQRRKLNSGLSSLPANGSPMSKTQTIKGKDAAKKANQQPSAKQQQSTLGLQQTNNSGSDTSQGVSNKTSENSTSLGDSKAEKRHRRKRNKRASQLASTPNAKTNGVVSTSHSESAQQSTGTTVTATQEPVDDGNLSQVELNDDDYDPSEWKGLDPFMSLFYAFGPLGILGSLEGFITPTDLMCSPENVVASTSMVQSLRGASSPSHSSLHQGVSGQEAPPRVLLEPAPIDASSQPARLQIEAPEPELIPTNGEQNGLVPQEKQNGSGGVTLNGKQEKTSVSSKKILQAAASTPKARAPVAAPSPSPAAAGPLAPVPSPSARTASSGGSGSSSSKSDSSDSSDSDSDAAPRASTLDLRAIEKAKMAEAASAENVKMIERDDSSDESSSEDSDEDASDSDSSESFATAEASSAHLRRLGGRRSLGAVAASVFSRSESAGRRTSLPSKLRLSHPARSPIKSRDSNTQDQPSTPESPISQPKISLSQILEQEEAEEAAESEGESDALSRFATDASTDDLDADEEREIAEDALDRQRRSEAEKERAARRKSALGGVGTGDLTFEDVEDGDEALGDSGEMTGDFGVKTSIAPDDAYETPVEPMPTPAQKSVPTPSQTSKRPVTLSSISSEDHSQSPDVSMFAQASLSPGPVKKNSTVDESAAASAAESGDASDDDSEEETQIEVELTNPSDKEAGTQNLLSKQEDTLGSQDASSESEPTDAVEPPSEKEEASEVDDDSSSESETGNMPVQNSAQEQRKETERSNENDQNEESAESSGSFSDDEEEEVHSPPRSLLSRGLDKLLPSRWNKPAETTGTAAKANGLSASQPEPAKTIFGSSQADLSSQTFGSSVFLSPRRNGSVPASAMPSLSQLNQMKKGRQSMSFLYPTASQASLPASQPLSSTTTVDKNWISNGDNSASESESSGTESDKNEPPVAQRRSTRNRTQLKSYKAKW